MKIRLNINRQMFLRIRKYIGVSKIDELAFKIYRIVKDLYKIHNIVGSVHNDPNYLFRQELKDNFAEKIKLYLKFYKSLDNLHRKIEVMAMSDILFPIGFDNTKLCKIVNTKCLNDGIIDVLIENKHLLVIVTIMVRYFEDYICYC
jgi:hypothetical protein